MGTKDWTKEFEQMLAEALHEDQYKNDGPVTEEQARAEDKRVILALIEERRKASVTGPAPQNNQVASEIGSATDHRREPTAAPDMRAAYEFFGSEFEREDLRLHDLMRYGPRTGPVITYVRRNRRALLLLLAIFVAAKFWDLLGW